MRHHFAPQIKFGTVDIADIEFEIYSRHELLPILMALQYVYMNCKEQLDQILELIRTDIGIAKNQFRGCIGMTYWETLVLTSLRLGCDLDYDQLADIATNHRKIQQMLGISTWEGKYYSRSAIHENLNRLSAKTIQAISDIFVGIGHQLVLNPLQKVRGDTFVLKKNIHYPTDTNLLYDGVRKIIEISVKLADEFGISGWRQHEYLKRKVKKIKQKISQVARSRSNDRDAQLKALYGHMINEGDQIVDKALETILVLNQKKTTQDIKVSEYWEGYVSELHYYIAGTEYIRELACRRMIDGETIPNPDKVFSLFEPDTELINRGKTPYPIEFGHRVLIIQDCAGFIIGSHVLEKGFTDEKIITDVMRKIQDHYNGKIKAASFDKGFWAPRNFKDMSKFIPLVVLPKKGGRSESECVRESSDEFRKVRKWHSGVESAIHGLMAGNGLSVCRDKGVNGYNRYVAMAILGRNIQTIGDILVERKREQMKKDITFFLI